MKFDFGISQSLCDVCGSLSCFVMLYSTVFISSVCACGDLIEIGEQLILWLKIYLVPKESEKIVSRPSLLWVCD